MKQRMSVPIFGVLLLVISVTIVTAQAEECPELVKRALSTVATLCENLGRNEACYGNDRLQAELDSSIVFNKPADRSPVESIRTIRTFGLDEQAGTWGIAVLNIQANLPDTLPGQAVKFILYGDVALQNAVGQSTPELGPMQAFYFTTSAIKPNCKEAPASSLVIQSPKGYRVQLTANGMDLNVGSSVALTAQRGGKMRLTTMEGMVYARHNGDQMMIPEGFEVSVGLGGEDGFTPEAMPDAAYMMDGDEWQMLANAAEGIMEDPIEMPDMSQWDSADDYCADPAHAEMCADPDFVNTMRFEPCPAEVCSPPVELEAAGEPDACADLFCIPMDDKDCSDCVPLPEADEDTIPCVVDCVVETVVDEPPVEVLPSDQAPVDVPPVEPPADEPPPLEDAGG